MPTAGSAYTYAYATIGEIFAWIIGWDLILEFALGAAVVARGWSGYLAELLRSCRRAASARSAVVNWVRCSSCWSSAWSRIVGIRESARVTNTLVLVKVAICVFVIVAGAVLRPKAPT